MKNLSVGNMLKTCFPLAMVFACLFYALPGMAAEPTTTATEPDYPVSGRMEITPITDKEMEVHFTIDIERIWDGPWSLVGDATSDTLADSKAWITVLWAGIDGCYSEARQYTEIPFEDIAVSGDTYWEGNALETRSIKVQSTIRLPEEGVWAFIGQFAGENWTRPVKRSWYVAVADGIAVPYYTQDLEDSPLTYLECFDYGQNGKLPADEHRPVYLELDMDHPPLAGEEVMITCLANSPIYDAENFTVEAEFKKRTVDNEIIEVSAAQIVVESKIGWDVDAYGNTIWKKWETDIPVNETKIISYTLRFPEPGEWQIHIYGSCVLPEWGYYGTSDTIRLTITDDKAYYGWADTLPETTTTIPSSNTPTIDITVGPTPPPNPNAVWWWVGGGVLVVVGVLVIVLVRKRHRKIKKR